MKHALILALLLSGTAFAGELRLGWTAPANAVVVSYNVYIGTATGVYDPAIPVPQPFTITDGKVKMIATVPDGGPYFACIKTVVEFDQESICSNEVSTWARATILDTPSVQTGPLAFTMTVTGTNYSPGNIITIVAYPGLTQGLQRRIDASNVEVDYVLAGDAAGGSTDVKAENVWTDSAGIGGLIGPTAVDALTITPTVLPPPPTGAVVL
ncbi:MAG: hypothetical protein V3S43_06505 [Acidimicrobiia bacterium]